MERGFRIIEHPSDLGIEAAGRTLSEAFIEAAYGLISVITDRNLVEPFIEKSFSVEGADPGQLLVRFLSEILYLYDGRGFIAREIEISSFSETWIRGKVAGEFFSASKHRMGTDVKAVTYHKLVVRHDKNGGIVQVFLDI